VVPQGETFEVRISMWYHRVRLLRGENIEFTLFVSHYILTPAGRIILFYCKLACTQVSLHMVALLERLCTACIGARMLGVIVLPFVIEKLLL
jgi:hypothetical protein